MRTKEFNPTFLDLVTSQPMGGRSGELTASAAVLDVPAEPAASPLSGGQAFVQAAWLKDFLDGSASGGKDPSADLTIVLPVLTSA